MVKPTVISTFAGGGGSSLGYQWAGFKELLAIDFDKNSCDTLKANFHFPIWQRDIKEVIVKEILDFCKIKKGELDILDGSPPCQGFSTAGKRNLNDSRNDLFLDFVRLIEGLQPKVFIMENVSGMIKGKYKGIFNEILKILKNTNYKVKVKLMNAMWYEVPQSRERVFFVGVRNDLNIEPSFPKSLNKIITVNEVINIKGKMWNGIRKTESNIKSLNKSSYTIIKNANIKIGGLTDKYGKLWDKIPEGKSASYLLKKGYNSCSKLHPNKPSKTIPKTQGEKGFATMVHWKEPRKLTIDECKILCSFPIDYKLFGSYSTQWARLGNAVMPKMMYHIAKHIKKNILSNNVKAA